MRLSPWMSKSQGGASTRRRTNRRGHDRPLEKKTPRRRRLGTRALLPAGRPPRSGLGGRLPTLLRPLEGEVRPLLEAARSSGCLGADQYPALHRPASGQVEHADPPFPEQSVRFVFLAADDQVVLVDADAHGSG